MRVCWILCRLDHSTVIVTTLHKYKLLSCPRHLSHSPTSFVSPCYSMYTLCTQAWGPGLSGQRPDIDTTMLHVTEDWDALIDIYSLSNWTWSWCCNLQFCASMAPTPRWGECLISNVFSRAFNRNRYYRYSNIYYTYRRHSDIAASQYALTGPEAEEAYINNTPFEFTFPRALLSKVCIYIYK